MKRAETPIPIAQTLTYTRTFAIETEYALCCDLYVMIVHTTKHMRNSVSTCANILSPIFRHHTEKRERTSQHSNDMLKTYGCAHIYMNIEQATAYECACKEEEESKTLFPSPAHKTHNKRIRIDSICSRWRLGWYVMNTRYNIDGICSFVRVISLPVSDVGRIR